MRSFIVSAVVAATAIAGAAVGLPAEANAAARHHPHHRAHIVAPYVRQDPYRSFNQVDPPAPVPVMPADPYSTYRWPPSGGAT